MIVSIFYVLLAILGLSFLIFIHELGHFYMARRLGMRVETFSIGFGKPIYSWIRDGVRWQVGWLLFGGYVKIAGMDTQDQKDPYLVKEGFFGKSPLDRIKVAFAGPLANLVFAILAFAVLWVIGGREKNFSEYTHKIGWIDPKSELYAKGVRPGDEITAYNNEAYEAAKDHLYAPMTADGELEVKGNKVDYYSGQKESFAYNVKTYSHPNFTEKDILTAGILQPASYVMYDRQADGQDNPLPEGSPMQDSGIQYGDRIVWIDGEPIYSMQQLAHVLNDSRVLLTIQRGQDTFLRRVPLVRAEELKLDPEFKEELIDWQFEAGLNGVKIYKLYTLPYNLNNEGVVESVARFIDRDKEEDAFPRLPFSTLEMPLEPGDKIIAVSGFPVNYSYEILGNLQDKHVNVIIQRDPKLAKVSSWKGEDADFDKEINQNQLHQLVSEIGLKMPTVQSVGDLFLLEPIMPKMRSEFNLSPESQALLANELEAQRKEIESIDDPEKRAWAMHQFENWDKQLLLGLPQIHDRKVDYNPEPFTLYSKVIEEIGHTLKALFTGYLNPKWMSGPIGIVQVVHTQSMVSLKESLYWLGAISLNLGVLNLLPLPVLDGGTICFSLYELITGRRMKAKTMERLIIPFAILLIGFLLFLTYHDVTRIVKDMFH